VRLIHAQGRSLFSTSIRNPSDRVRLADAPAEISGVWATGESRAVVGTKNGAYLADLRAPRAMVALSVPAELAPAGIDQVSASADGRRLALGVRTTSGTGASAVQVYDLAGEGADRLAVRSSFTAGTSVSRNLSLSHSGRYLAVTAEHKVDVVDLQTRTTKTVTIEGGATVTRTDWIGDTEQVLVSAGASVIMDGTGVNTTTPGYLTRVDAATGAATRFLEGANIRGAAVSPDGRYLAVVFFEGPYSPSGSTDRIVNTISFRSLANPGVELAPLFRHETRGRSPAELRLGEWSRDSTAFQVHSLNTGGQSDQGAMLLSIVTGQPILQRSVTYYNLSRVTLALAGPFYVLDARHLYQGPDAPSEQSIVVRNVDGSEETTLFSAKVTPNVENNELPITSAQVVQVVAP
jgi:hypothetical protein